MHEIISGDACKNCLSRRLKWKSAPIACDFAMERYPLRMDRQCCIAIHRDHRMKKAQAAKPGPFHIRVIPFVS